MSAINITTLITDAKEENGVMNEMMELVQTYLAAEYRANRIDSNDYAQVYLSSLNGVMDKALQFALNKDKMSAELEILKIQKDIALIEKSKLEQEKLLIAAQVSKVTAETLLIEENTLTSVKQKLQIQAEINR